MHQYALGPLLMAMIHHILVFVFLLHLNENLFLGKSVIQLNLVTIQWRLECQIFQQIQECQRHFYVDVFATKTNCQVSQIVVSCPDQIAIAIYTVI